jgi:lysophospholipase L1-like esterase
VIRPLRLLLAAVMLVGVPVSTATEADAARAPIYYLSLGDSLAVGEQPVGSFKHGYANQLYWRARQEIPSLELVKRGCPGESTDTMITGDWICPYPAGSQLDQAVAFLNAHRGRIAFITITIGFNDVGGTDGVVCWDFRTGVFSLSCVRGELPNIKSNLGYIIDTLQAAAPSVPIAGMSYYDPFLGYWIVGPRGEALARYNERTMQTLDAALISTYSSRGAAVADVAGPDFFDTANFTDMVWTPFGEVPVNVAHTCRWTWFCSPQYLFDLHANDVGYRVIAEAFWDVLHP